MRRFLTLLVLFVIFQTNLFSQNNLCENSLPFCTDTVYNFPAGVNAGTAQSGAAYTCLGTQPNPAWYYMEVLNSGPISIYMYSTPAVDIDFSLWGPFTNQTSPCVAQLTAGNTVDCSYSTNWNETADIPNAVTGQIYILLICNYSNNPCNINFQQSNTGTIGHGTTNCGILAPPVDNNGPLCVGQTLNLTAQTGPTGCTYYWTGPNSFVSTQQNPVITNVTLAEAGDYFLQVIVGPDTSNIVSTTVVVYPVPTSDFTLSLDSVCIGEETTLTYTGTGSPTATYTWDVDGGTPNVNTGPGPHNVSWASSGNVSVSLVVSENGCTSPPTYLPVYVKTIPTSTFTVVSPVCQGSNSTITYTGTGTANATYNWNFPSGNVQSGSDQGPYQVSWNTAGSYSLELIVTENGCTSDITFASVEVWPLPIVDITTDLNSGCMPLTVEFSDNNNTPPAVFVWSFGDGTANSNQQNPTHTYTNHGTFTVGLTVTDTNGCVNSGSETISVYPLPQADFTFSPEVGTIGLTINLNDSSTGNINHWTWNFGNEATPPTSVLQNPSTAFGSTGYQTITLLVQTVNGCVDSISKQILIVDITIPNVFTPNGDGINDFFVVDGIDLVENCSLTVFNRWGRKVYETNSYQNDWDGGDLADGVYYFIFTLPENIITPVNGTITIIR
ncbi:MAG: PKD domain-containing protein [Bacteroidales bacterium]|nr:PKD domain-containing protein [Bacteroidales bacterium]